MAALLEIKNLHVKVGSKEILKGLNLTIEAGEILECHEQARHTFEFPYLSMNAVMGTIKKTGVKIIEQQFDNVCRMTIECDADALPDFQARLSTALNGF